MRIAMLAPIAWSIPPVHYRVREHVIYLLTEGLIKQGMDVTLFATGDSVTSAKLSSVCSTGRRHAGMHCDALECLHCSALFEKGDEFDLIHNHAGFRPLTYTGMTSTPVVTTIHDRPAAQSPAVYEKYNHKAFYISVSNAHRAPTLEYMDTIYYCVDTDRFAFQPHPDQYLLFWGEITHDTGAGEAIRIAGRTGRKLILAGEIRDRSYYEKEVAPYLEKERIVYLGGSVSREGFNQVLGRASALVCPVTPECASALSVVEAMACGTPTIAFRHGSMPEIIQHGENGFLVENIDEAVEAVGRIGNIDRSRCRETVGERFGPERMVADYQRVYSAILEKTKREDHRPWGYYVVLSDEPHHKVKRIVVYPGKRLSLQRHERRSEHWHVIQGEALVTKDDQQIPLKAGESVDIPQGAKHRIENPSQEDMAFIEVQRGDYFGEDDIERFEDDYGRA